MSEGMRGMMARLNNKVNKRMRDETLRALVVVGKYREGAMNVEGNSFEMSPADFFVLDNYIKTFSRTCGLLD